MQLVKSCGFLIFRNRPRRQFLLMRHRDRWDIPKGHVDPGETDLQCALRELREETGILASMVSIDPEFRFVTEYLVRTGGEPKGTFARKQLTVFLGSIEGPGEITLSEHIGYEWWDWSPPLAIQAQTIDDLVERVRQYFDETDTAKPN